MSGWSVSLETIAANAKVGMDTVARKVTMDLFRSVVLRSPVDTGRFRANWNVSFGAPNYSTTLDTNKGRGEVEAGKALTLPVGGVVYLTNGLPYAGRLEYGSSKQAPAGMVRLAVSELDAFVRQATA